MQLAAKESETGVDIALRLLIDQDQLTSLEAIRELISRQGPEISRIDVGIDGVGPSNYDVLLNVEEGGGC